MPTLAESRAEVILSISNPFDEAIPMNPNTIPLLRVSELRRPIVGARVIRFTLHWMSSIEGARAAKNGNATRAAVGPGNPSGFRARLVFLYSRNGNVRYRLRLLVRYTQRIYSDLQVQYNSAFRVLMELLRFCSGSGMFLEAQTDDFNAIIRKRIAFTMERLCNNPNGVLNIMVVRWVCLIL
ncbi:hypothetical protein EVAR_36586_1 [Eumeta japonica]|uniref:Uncharacterized protein n=1 Tax=Eumeta variegata TaxID=151549 RepID=A0A4C1XM26_EUMVA|nr:hypothetical protein EVAR_36586_1 [Eumeta japonica]